MKGFDCRDESLWIPKYNYVSGYKARSIHLWWLDFSGEGAIGGWKHTADMSAIPRCQLSRHVWTFKDQFLFGRVLRKKMTFVNVSSKTWSPVESVAHTFTPLQRLVVGFGVSPEMWSYTSASFQIPATVTKGIVLFHRIATSPLLWLSTHKSVKIEISGIRTGQAIFKSLCVKRLFRRQAGGKCISACSPPETRSGAFIKKDTS